ncbi:3-dehydroquinate synthase [Paludisphaera mucosa]|uniref:3-dehydroquinate synthase n=1 Tax=Paludisphaera mucosa TaxID=3030827 RepID=A0ABT6FG05_9BACT|nr:3-dehydroquinate synthase [Paludisphaera mucosa]MDG3006498.1 3-dehydroquinate synthase [Paludisphaera mucosa]
MPRSLEDAPTTVPVRLGERSYDIAVADGGWDALPAFLKPALERSWAGRGCLKALILTDDHVAKLPYPGLVARALGSLGIEATTSVVPHGEASKGLATAAGLYEELVATAADRHTLVVAVGGGVIGDLGGFVAATFARGLPLLMVPTTLLAQVDSSVGGKVGVNLPKVKNIVGSFHQPIAVWIDVASLNDLPDRELRCGLAEVVKYGVILDAAFFDSLEADAEAILGRRPESLRRIVARSCELKADVVSKDEREETGLRAVLNFGHTIGHAVEATAGYGGAFQHGEAVAVGMVAESRLAERLGWVGRDFTTRLTRLLDRFGLPTSIAGLDPGPLLESMARDKKNQGGRIRLVLPRRMGHVELTDAAETADLKNLLDDLCGPAPL